MPELKLSPNVQQALVRALTLDVITKAYSGKPGCGCGCRGTWRDGRSRLASSNLKQIQLFDMAVEVTKGLEGDICFSLETVVRNRWVYVPRPVVAKLLRQVRAAGIR